MDSEEELGDVPGIEKQPMRRGERFGLGVLSSFWPTIGLQPMGGGGGGIPKMRYVDQPLEIRQIPTPQTANPKHPPLLGFRCWFF